MRGDRRSTKQQQQQEEMGEMGATAATTPFANLSVSGCGGGDIAPSPPPSALKLSVSGRLSRSFSKLGLMRMSSSNGGGYLSRRTLLDEGKSR